MLNKKRLLVLLMALLLALSELPFAGTAFAAFEISLKDARVVISPLTYNGQIQKPTITVTVDQSVLVEGTDYELEFANPSSINAGKYRVTITGKGMYSGSVNVQYVIAPKKITPKVKLAKKDFIYNGAAQKPAVTAVKAGGVKLRKADYSVVYPSATKNVGVYRVKVKLKGNYTGTGVGEYQIHPKGTALKGLKSGKRYIMIYWTRQTARMAKSRVNGYQIMLSTKKDFSKHTKTVKVKGYSIGSRKVTKLKPRTRYWVKIRTYMTVKGKTFFSKWSTPKSIVTK